MKTKFYSFGFFRILIFLLLIQFFNCKTLFAQQTLIDANGWNAYVHLPWDYDLNSSTYPTIIFFPGTGEVGSDASKVIANGPGAYITQGWNGNVKVGTDSIKFIIISLQPPGQWPVEADLDNRIQLLKSMYRIDNSRLHLTGLSMGGWCSNTYVTGDPYGGPYYYANQVATVVEVEGVKPDDNSPYPDLFDNFANNGGRLLGFEQVNDSRDIQTRVDRMNSTRANSGIFVSTNYGGGGHCCWEQFYGGNGVEPQKFTLDGITQNIYEWMAKNPLPSGVEDNQSPVANAGSDQTIALPANTVTLNGSGSDDGSISGYAWSKISGPSSGTIASPNSASTEVNDLEEGVYQFELTVTDDKGTTGTDVVQVTVSDATNQAPVADAGPDISIILPNDNITLNGTGSDSDGTISSYLWTQVSGPSASTIETPAEASCKMSNLVAGIYVFRLKVTDNKGASATNKMQLTVKPGNDQDPVTYAKQLYVNVYGGSNPYNNSEWNNWNVGAGSASNITSDVYKFSDGSYSGINSVLNYSQAVGDNSTSYQGGMAPKEVLRYTSYSKQARTLTIDGLSASQKYSIELYASRWSSGNSTIFTVNSVSDTINTYRNFTNKASFTHIVPDDDGQITINIQSLNNYNYLNGFMITQEGSESGKPSNSGPVSESVEIFPNPVNDKIILKVSNSTLDNMNIRIADLNGGIRKQITLKHDSPITQTTIPVNELPAGMYIIKVQMGSWSQTKKIIKP